MRTLVHLSDLHFGRIDPVLVEPCLVAVQQARPDLVVISGDLTQRARAWQFRAAREFLDRLPTPQIVTPGNHDVPLHNLMARFYRPFRKFRRFITEDLEPAYEDDEIAVTAINTARSFTIAGGIMRAQQVERAREWFCSLPRDVCRIVVTHHPFDLPQSVAEKQLVRHAKTAMGSLARCGADIFLAGHLHLFHSDVSARRYHIPGHSAIIVQAGTGLSTRTRGESNAFNVLRIASHEITVETFAWEPEKLGFICSRADRFSRSDSGWSRLAA